jgi:hypothetical protein
MMCIAGKRFEIDQTTIFRGESWSQNIKRRTSACLAIIMENEQEADLLTRKEKQPATS